MVVVAVVVVVVVVVEKGWRGWWFSITESCQSVFPNCSGDNFNCRPCHNTAGASRHTPGILGNAYCNFSCYWANVTNEDP